MVDAVKSRPAVMPSEAPAVKEAAVEAPAEEPSIDALFGPADSGDADTKDTPADDYAALIDDIFGQHRSIESESQVPAMPVSTVVGTIEVGATNSYRVVSFEATQSRTWVDNTGQFSTTGRLIEIQSNAVRLLKDNGRTCTVS